MKRVLSKADLPASPPSQPLWTALIPMAGKGSRLGFHLPKALYPIAGKPILAHLVDTLSPLVANFVFVVSADGRELISQLALTLLPNSRFSLVIQAEPKGMGDAVLCGLQATTTEHTLVIWGDQVTITRETVGAVLATHEARPTSKVTVPTIMKQKPYIHFERDRSGRIVKILQAREGEIKTDIGENDCGVFAFRTEPLRKILFQAAVDHLSLGNELAGAKTGEFNLLPLLPKFEGEEGEFVTLQVATEEETLGVNTPEEAELVESILRSRSNNSKGVAHG